jgi:hypothetical protein
MILAGFVVVVVANDRRENEFLHSFVDRNLPNAIDNVCVAQSFDEALAAYYLAGRILILLRQTQKYDPAQLAGKSGIVVMTVPEQKHVVLDCFGLDPLVYQLFLQTMISSPASFDFMQTYQRRVALFAAPPYRTIGVSMLHETGTPMKIDVFEDTAEYDELIGKPMHDLIIVFQPKVNGKEFDAHWAAGIVRSNIAGRVIALTFDAHDQASLSTSSIGWADANDLPSCVSFLRRELKLRELNIAIVDDETTWRRTTESVVVNASPRCKFRSFRSFEELFATGDEFDVYIVDNRLMDEQDNPLTDGVTGTRMLLKRNPAAKVIGFCLKPPDKDPGFVNAGAIGFVSKELDVPDVIAAFRRKLESI